MVLLEPGEPALVAGALARAFRESFDAPPDVVARAPGRVNLIGEHTDYNGGLCLPLALPHATYAAVRGRSDGLLRLASVQQPQPVVIRLSDVGPGRVGGWAAYVAGVAWALREAGHEVPGFDLLVDGRVPLGAGLSSSAALECSMATALMGLLGTDLSLAVRRELVQACIRAENEVAGAPTGGMDQTVSLLATEGAALLIDFSDGVTRPVGWHPEDAGLVLLVTDTRVTHRLSDATGGGYATRRADCDAAAKALGVASLRDAEPAVLARISDARLRRRARHVVSEIARVHEAVAAIEEQDWAALGPLFAASHASLRDDFEVSCPELDVVVDTATRSGAIASRMTGGGFGGSTVSLVPRERVVDVVAAIDTAFAGWGWTAPAHLRVTAAAPAGLVTHPA